MNRGQEKKTASCVPSHLFGIFKCESDSLKHVVVFFFAGIDFFNKADELLKISTVAMRQASTLSDSSREKERGKREKKLTRPDSARQLSF